MKKVITLLFVLTLVFGLHSSALADAPAPGGPFSTEFIVQNLDTTSASCSFILYGPAGNQAFVSDEYTINASDKMSFYTGNDTIFGGLADGAYSAVVSCTTKVAAVVNFSDANSGASHSGIVAPGTAFYTPVIYDDFYSYYTNVYAQNATSAAVDVTLAIYAPGGTTPVKTQTLNAPAYSTVVFEQQGLDELTKNVAYSAKVTGTGNIAVVANIYGGENNDQLYSYNGFASGSLTAYTPVIYSDYYGYNTNLAIQNIGTAATAVTVEYFNKDGVLVKTDNYDIQANSLVSIYTPNIFPTGYKNILIGAKITSATQPIVALVNESAYGKLQAASYNGFVEGGTEMRSPVVMRNYYSFNTSVTCQNIGTAAADITITYAGIANPTTATGVPVNGTKEFYQPTDANLNGVPVNWSSSATITSNQNIVCVVNESSGSIAGDQLYSFNGVKP